MGKKRKSYFNQEKSGPKKFKFNNKIKLAAHMKGFLITYNCKFTFCINEAKKLLDQYSIRDETPQKDDNKSTDIEKLLKEELDDLNQKDKDLVVLDTNAKHTMFILSECNDPNQVATSIFQTIEDSKKPLGRFVQRLVPVLNTCKAYPEDIEKCFKETLDRIECVQKSDTTLHGDQSVPFTYCCVLKTSNNNQVSRDTVFKLAGVYMQGKNRANKVEFDNPDYVLHVHVICSICFVSFLPKYFDYRKYNLIEMGCKFLPSKQIEKKDNKTVELESKSEKVELNDESSSSSSSSSSKNDDVGELEGVKQDDEKSMPN